MLQTFKYLAALVGFFASFVAVVGIFSAKMPTYEFVTDCGVSFDESGNLSFEIDDPKYDELSREVIEFINFAKRHTAEVIYLNFRIEASDHAGSCAMHASQLQEYFDIPDTTFGELDITFGISNLESGIDDRKSDKELWIRTSEYNAGRSQVFLPAQNTIETNGLYTNQEDSHYYSVSGPFVLQYYQGNGFDAISFEPIERSEIFWQEVGCAKRRLEYPFFLRRVIPCI